MNTQEEEAKDVIDQWGQSYKQLQEANAELSESLNKAESSLQTLQFELSETRSALSAATAESNEAADHPDDSRKSATLLSRLPMVSFD